MNDEIGTVNKHVETYINYYQSLKKPGYAVLVNGDWGTGKTHLIHRIIKNEDKCYISLFGLTSIQEVHTSLFVKMYPRRAQARKLFNLFGNSSVKASETTLAIGPLIGNIANALIKEEVDNSKVIILDDLERCTINLNDLFGAINKYVEHHKCKVIVIAHDKKLNKKLIDRREKVFGQVIKIYPDTKNAFDNFVESSNAPRAFEPIKKIVYDSFIASECKSLRILYYTINDCLRLLKFVPLKLLNDKDLLSELFTLFTALNINHRLGTLTEDILESRNSNYFYLLKESEEKGSLEEIKKTYEKNGITLSMDSDLLSNQVLIETIVNGYYNKENIECSLNDSRHFTSQERKSPWLTIINFDSIDTSTVNQALQEIYDGFKKLDITNRGDILHSINLLFMLSKYNHINKNLEEVYDYFINYIKRLQRANKLPPAELYNKRSSFNDSAHGYGFWIESSYRDYSVKISAELDKQERIALKKKYPLYLSELTKNLKENTSLFCNQISRTRKIESNDFGYTSILSGFKAYEFVDMWLSIEIKYWHKVRIALVDRYSSGALKDDLKDEDVWIENVKINIRHRASKATGIDRLRISRLLIKLQ